MKNPSIAVVTALTLGLTLLIAGCASTEKLAKKRPYQQDFLTNYKLLKPRGDDEWVYFGPDAQRLMAAAKGVVVDQPEIHIASGSPYTGAKPATLTAIAEAMRSDIVAALKKNGYNVVDEPGPNILLVRLALTDIYLQEKERRILEYTPIGFVIDAGVSAMQTVMEKVDILGMTLQVAVTDSGSKAMVGEMVAQRGGNEQRITFEEFQQQMTAWGERLSCQISNARLPTSQQVDCSKEGNTG